MLKPVGRNVLIKPEEKPKERKSDGGIVIVGDDKDSMFGLVRGMVIDVGDGGYGSEEWDGNPNAVLDESFAKPSRELVGMNVLYKNSVAHAVADGHIAYDIVDVDSIIAICE
jgi:co-chaperonin GroES (HSP10)